METRLSNIFKTTNVTNLTKVIQQNSYRLLQVASKWKTLKQPVYFLKAVEFWPTYDIHFDITLAIFREKLQNHTFYKAHRSLSKHVNIPINRAAHYEITAFFKIWKIYVFLAAPFSNTKKCWHLEFLMNQVFGQRFIILKKMKYRGQLLLKLRAVEVDTSFHWISSRST